MLVNFALEQTDFEVVEATHIDSEGCAFFATGECVLQQFDLLLGHVQLEMLAQAREVVQENLVLIILLGSLLESPNEGSPSLFEFLLNFYDYHIGLLLFHLRVNLAKLGVFLRHVPTVVLFATFDANWIGHVLTPKFALIRLHVLPDGLLEIFVRNLTISIAIQSLEQILELLLGNFHAPMGQVKFEFALLNEARLAHIHVNKGFPHRFPLLVNLVHHFGE